MRRDCELYTSPATLPPVKTIFSLPQSNPMFVVDYNQTLFCHLIRRLCAFLALKPISYVLFFVIKGGSYLLSLTEQRNLCLVPMCLHHFKFLEGSILLIYVAVWRIFQATLLSRCMWFQRKCEFICREQKVSSCQGTQSQFKSFVEVIFYFTWSYTKHSSVIKSNQITVLALVSVSLSLNQSTKLILLEVIVPCLMMMSWLVLFSGVLSWRVCSPAVVKARLTVNPLCLSRRQQTDWSGLAEARAARRGYSLLAKGQQSSSYTELCHQLMERGSLDAAFINMALIPMMLGLM